MARRPKTSPLEDLTGLLARLPWWLSLAIGVVAYLVLHHLAVQPAATLRAGQLPGFMAGALFHGLEVIGQYLIPALCAIAAVISFARRRTRAGLAAGVASSQAPDALEGMSWQHFELLVGEAYRLQGYQVAELGGAGPDGGVDLVLRKDGEKYLVQCKQWKAFKVGVQIVRELFGVMAARGAAGGFVVTSGTFTEEAIAFASGRNVELVDGAKLFGMIRQAKASQSSRSAAAPVRSAAVPSAPPPAMARPATAPAAVVSCPICSRAMTLRTAKRGTNAGNSFWGCSGYPSCKGTRPA